MRFGPKNIKILFTGKRLTRFGGILLISLFLRKMGLKNLISQRIKFKQRNNRYSLSESLLALIYPMTLGLERIETTHLLRQNGVFQYLTGLPSYPNPTALRRFLIRLPPQVLSQICQLHNYLLRHMTQIPKPRTSLILDLDSTVLTVYGRLQGARVGYNPHKRGRPSYHPLVCFEGKSKDNWCGMFRFGDAHTSTNAIEFLEACFAKIPPSVRSVKIRGDVGFYSHEIIEFIVGKRAKFAIIAKITNPIKLRVGGLKFRQISTGIAVAKFRYQPHHFKKPYRFIVIRKELPTEEDPAQLTLFQLDNYAYHVIVTNLNLEPENVWHFYNQRCAVELIVKELKQNYPLGRIPTRLFLANQAYFHILLLAYNLINWFKRLCLPEEFHTKTLKTIRAQLLSIPSELIWHGKMPALKLPINFLHRETFAYAMRKIKNLKPEL